ncbi:14748_t:CDS:2, partial [Dentiscutata heterogama]
AKNPSTVENSSPAKNPSTVENPSPAKNPSTVENPSPAKNPSTARSGSQRRQNSPGAINVNDQGTCTVYDRSFTTYTIITTSETLVISSTQTPSEGSPSGTSSGSTVTTPPISSASSCFYNELTGFNFIVVSKGFNHCIAKIYK